MKILLVEDDAYLVATLAKGLRERAYAVDTARDGERAIYLASVNSYDLIVLDVMLPVKEGRAVCRELRAVGLRTPILMLTARDSVEDRIAGLDSGADDYLVKPFDFQELLARLRALLRRQPGLRPAVAEIADLRLDTAGHIVSRGGRLLNLTAKEYALLEFLVLNQGRVVGREEIGQHVWDENFDPLSNIIDVYVKRLRAKVDAGSAQCLIHTRRGEGYVLRAERRSGDEA